MKALKKCSVLACGSLIALSLIACGGQGSTTTSSSTSVRPWDWPSQYTHGTDKEVYEEVYEKFDIAAGQAKAITNNNERFVKYAEAEAQLLNTGTFIPNTTEGGNYAITRVAPKTLPQVLYGNDMDRLKSVVAIEGKDTFVKSKEREELTALWAAAKAGGAAYDPATYLTGKGYTLSKKYAATYGLDIETLDILNTSKRSDTESMINCFDGLIEYDNLGSVRGALAKVPAGSSVPWTVSADGKTYTFEIRDDAYWYDKDGVQKDKVTADDFVAGFQHMLDNNDDLNFLVDGVVEGVTEYLEGGDFKDVGCKAEGNILTFTLVQPESYFPSRLAYSCFMPMSRSFFLQRGGAFTAAELQKQKDDGNYHFGEVTDLGSQWYNGAFHPVNITSNSLMKFAKNEGYYDAARRTIDEIQFIYDDSKNPTLTYTETCKGTYVGIGLTESTGLLQKAKADGNFEKYKYITDTTATTYFGGLNLNRKAFSLKGKGTEIVSTKSTDEKAKQAFYYAIHNVNFRKAILHGWNRTLLNALSVGEELAPLSLRNTYTAPEFVSIDADTTDSYGHVFKKGSSYGELVQYYCDKIGLVINTKDGQDGWYNPELAKHYAAVAKAELGGKWAGKVIIDVCYYSGSETNTAQAQATKKCLEETLGEFVEIRLLEAATKPNFYAATYLASGANLDADFYYGSGWGPDYADPSSYLDTMKAGGYMLKVMGLDY